MKVDGAAPRRFLRFLGLTVLRAEGCGGGFAASFIKRGAADAAGCVEGLHRFAQGATAPAALRVADCRSAAMLIKSALRIYLSVSYVMISILRIGSLRSPPPIRLRRTSPCSGGRIKHLESSLRKRLCSKHGLLCPRLRGWQRNWIHRGAVGDPRIQ